MKLLYSSAQNSLFTESQITEISYCKQGFLGSSEACPLSSTTFLEVFLVQYVHKYEITSY